MWCDFCSLFIIWIIYIIWILFEYNFDFVFKLLFISFRTYSWLSFWFYSFLAWPSKSGWTAFWKQSVGLLLSSFVRYVVCEWVERVWQNFSYSLFGVRRCSHLPIWYVNVSKCLLTLWPFLLIWVTTQQNQTQKLVLPNEFIFQYFVIAKTKEKCSNMSRFVMRK